MATPETAYTEVERLVKKFKGLSAAARKSYNEADTRKDFILPLFHALEWDTADTAEVSAEEKVSRGWVDFSFRLSGIPRFFLETKRVSEDLTDPRWVKQAIDYAWTKSVTWALLSDFEGLRVFNAEWKEDNPLRAQFIDFSVDTYLQDFYRLWWLSRPEIAAGTLDREAEKVGKKARKEPVSQRLFGDLKDWRHELFRHLRAYNKRYSPAQIDEAVLRLLNRLIFVRAAEDRGVEPPRLLPLLRDLTERGKLAYLPAELAKLFREMDATYDSDLFAEHFSEGLDCEPGPFVALIKGLHEERTGYVQYNFNAIDADVLGTAYEQYLGHVIAGARAAEVLEKRAKRKSQGIYYTPTFVVKYIVRQTLGRYLDEHGYNPARPVRVLDMSCGSGSFLIEAFDTLDRHLARERSQAHGEREDVVDYARRMEILTQCIYGVDKDEQAVAVAKLNLSLKALHARDKLPMLENIRVGDSLISGAPDELKAAFGKNWKEKNPFNWRTEFEKVMSNGGFDVIVGNPPYVRTESIPEVERDYFSRSDQFKCTYKKFDLYVLFLERAIHLLREGGRLGFIIPYPFLNQTYAEPLRRLILESACIESIVDLSGYKVFQDATVETCIIVLKKTSDRSLSKQNRINIISQGTYELGIQKSDKTAYEIQQSIFERTPQSKFRLDLRGNILPLIEKIEGQSIKLGQLYYVSKGIVAYSETDGRKKADFLHTRRVNRRCVPYLEGKDVQRYAIDFKDQYLDYQPSVMARPTFRELHESPKLLVRAIAQGLLGSYDTERFYADQKLICCVQHRYLGTHRQVRLSDDLISDPRFNDGYVLGLVNSRLLNYYYRIILFGGLSILPEDVRCLPIHIINFDDPAEKQQHDALVALVDEMLQLQKDYAEAEREKEDRRHALKRRMDEVDAAIDKLVYNLYGLTGDEIKAIEAGTR